MKVNVELGKNKKEKYSGKIHENKRKRIDNVFSISDDEETFDFENKSNKKLEEKEKQRIEAEIKNFICEHENPSEEKIGQNEYEKKKEQEKLKRNNIVYLGFKGKELTNAKRKKREQVLGDGSSDKQHSKEKNILEGKENIKEKVHKTKESKYDKRQKGLFSKTDSHSYDRKKEKRKDALYNCDNATGESFIDPKRSDIDISEIFKKKEKQDKEENENNKKVSPKYINALINSAKRRNLEKEINIQKKLKIDTEKQEKVFITSAYKKTMIDKELIKQEILKEEEEKEKEKQNIQKNYNLNLFYKNIKAPPNYDRINRRPYLGDHSSDSDY